MKEYSGKIYSIEKISKDTFKLVIKSSLNHSTPGQFISVLCGNKILRRPFSISDFEKIGENFSLTAILFKIKGEGTDFLSNMKEDDEINFLAPLGSGFKIENKRALLVGAGVGIAPMLFLKKELNKKNIENCLIAGFKSEDEVIKGYDEVTIGGSILDNLEDLIKEKNIETVCACGPEIVLRSVSKISKNLNISSQIALEKVMACGMGVCRGCVIKIIKNNIETQVSVCKDGPVFSGESIIWSESNT